MNAFVTHPSVRIKGTETNYEPVQCLDPNCHNRNPHMHCPFCIKAESYTDPVILKAHYRVKHVDKGIEFAGLKVLRCCDHCDIVGTIKGVKEFKGAHWHCYKCKNGFNRRDEAIKHYKTHFRNPQTTFQIQISQVESDNNSSDPNPEPTHLMQEELSHFQSATIHPALTEAVMSTTSADTTGLMSQSVETSLANGKSDGELQVSVAANETVGTSEGQQTIMIIQEDQLEHVQAELNNSASIQITNQEMIFANDERSILEKRLAELEMRVETLEMEKSQLEQTIEQLRVAEQLQVAEISGYQKREQELLSQLSIPLDDRIQELLTSLKATHEDLLHQQLAQLRRTYLQQMTGHIAERILIELPRNGDGDKDMDAKEECTDVSSSDKNMTNTIEVGEDISALQCSQEDEVRLVQGRDGTVFTVVQNAQTGIITTTTTCGDSVTTSEEEILHITEGVTLQPDSHDELAHNLEEFHSEAQHHIKVDLEDESQPPLKRKRT